MPTIRIDGVEYEVQAGKNLLESCLSLGLDLPYFCWHPAMGSIGACRQCAVVQYQSEEDEQAGRGRIVMGCMTPVSDGAIFSLDGDRAREFREAIVESLMLNHPHDCPVCAEGGECHLQDMTVMVGHRDRHYRGRKNTHRNQYLGPLLNHEMNRCIACYRCTRYYRDYAGGTDLAAMAAHDHVYFGRHEEGILESEFAGNLVEVCPTGVFTDKTLVHDYTRKWDLQSAPSVCVGCGVGCNTLPGERYGRLKRIHNRFNVEVNGYFLCDRGRFGGGFVNNQQRLDYPGLRGDDGRYNAVDHHQALQHMAEACRNARVAAIGSPRTSIEANFLLRQLVGTDNFCPGFTELEQTLVNLALELQQQSSAVIADIRSVESADAVLILGEDLTNTAPRLALAVRQSVRNKAYEMAAGLGLETWQDAAIRNLAQDRRSPLFIAASGDTRLDDVAEQHLSLAPQDVARLGFEVAAAIRGGGGVGNSDTAAGRIAAALMEAKRPLVISGTSSGSPQALQAAAAVAEALAGAGHRPMLNFTVPEANSLGQAMLTGSAAPSLEAIAERCDRGEIDTLLVLENDLYHRTPAALADRLLHSDSAIIAVDGLDNRTTSAARLVLPAANFAETEGTLVSLEGRAQRHYPVFLPQGERRPSWVWLLACMKELGHPTATDLHQFDDITRACAATVPALAGITGAAPDHHFLNVGVKIPRQPHRYSGRTAMRADISVHEPKQPEDEESPLAFSMEGLNRWQPGALLPFVWAPGWNSNQSLHRFQSEVGGPLRGGTAGMRLLGAGTTGPTAAIDPPPSFTPVEGRWQLVARHRIFGSEELSALSPGICELVEPGFVEMRGADAHGLGLTEGDGVELDAGLATLAVKINDSIPPGCLGYAVGHAGTANLAAGASVSLAKATNWQRPPQVISTDRSGGGHV
ncbi:NADH-quinone oxidoreductase subunit NuoG [Seongchinamella unica]|uniref:NADH-quinone oxidoreductase subunit G n=1 Tax=Seongchinamella unica TaxID=2547392 RepID=A0A4V2ZX46_9GAMM|nr:NADH-quinone oxidoreductase subunit NuoG [Seongchinamella unica]TDG12963.1 NADH-quinone oxidoreductase subunit NuoG [Seongchinamella unica]